MDYFTSVFFVYKKAARHRCHTAQSNLTKNTNLNLNETSVILNLISLYLSYLFIYFFPSMIIIPLWLEFTRWPPRL